MVWLVYAKKNVTEWSLLGLKLYDEFLVSYWLSSVCNRKGGIAMTDWAYLATSANATDFFSFSYRFTGKVRVAANSTFKVFK